MRYIIEVISMIPPRYIVLGQKPTRKHRGYGRVRTSFELTTVMDNATGFRHRRAERFVRSMIGKSQHKLEIVKVPKGWFQRQQQITAEALKSMSQASSEGSQPVRGYGGILEKLRRIFK